MPAAIQYLLTPRYFLFLGVLDVPIPFESDAVKAVMVNAFGGLMGGQNHDVYGFRGEITYRQALAVTSLDSMFRGYNGGGSFNEYKYFKKAIPGAYCFRESNLISIVVPEGFTMFPLQAFLADIDYIELPSTTTRFTNNTFGSSTIKLWATTPPIINYSYNSGLTKIMVPQSALPAYQADEQWSQYGSRLEGF